MNSSTSSTYRQYKHGTEAMLKWLSTSLDKLGITYERKLEDASIRSLLDLASRAQRKGASMLSEVRFALEDALKIRRQYHAWYSRQLSQRSHNGDNKHIEQSNEAHAAFIDLLQDVHDLFTPNKAPTDQQPSSLSDKKVLEISNIFTKLEIGDETTEECHVPTANSAPRVEQAAKPWIVRKAQMLVEDKLLELYCLYNDANNIRGYLSKKWAAYASRELDIISAAMVTQEALELFSEAEKSFEDKYGTTPKDEPSCSHPKHLDIMYYLAIGEPMTSTYTSEQLKSMSASDIEIAKLDAQSQVADRQRRIAELGWMPSDELDYWLMRPAVCVLEKMLTKAVKEGGDAWVLRQACREHADRADALEALGFDESTDCVPEADAQELLNTFIDVYAGMIFMHQNPDCFMAPPDIITSLWLGNYDCSIRMALSMQILHDIRTAKSGSRKLDILTQVYEDYKRLGVGTAIFSRSSEEETHTSQPKHKKLLKSAAIEHAWLEGRAPGHIHQPSNMSKAESRKLSELPLATNPVHAGMILLDLLFRNYIKHISYSNRMWFLIPCAHLLNWLAVRVRGETADFQDLFPDMHTAIGLLGPRLVWLGATPPGALDPCRNRILLAWGLQLTDFYKRIVSGDIPKAEELFKKIKNNTNAGHKMTDEQLKLVLDGKLQPSSLAAQLKGNKLSHPLKIETSQSTPLLDATRRNLHSSDLMNAQQNHIRKIVLGSVTKRKTSKELDMLSYLDAFFRTARAEMPRLIFPFRDVSQQCGGLSMPLFGGVRDGFDLPSEIVECVGLDKLMNMKPTDSEDKLGSGAQSVTSLLALATIFGERVGRRPLERLMLEFIEKDWDKSPLVLPRNHFTKEFVEMCKEFGFEIPECAAAALSLNENPDQTG